MELVSWLVGWSVGLIIFTLFTVYSVCTEGRRHAYSIFIEKSQGSRPLKQGVDML